MNLSIITLALFAGAVGLVGIIVGYFLRFILLLGKKGSMELTIRQQLLDARTEAQKIVDEAGAKAEEISKEIRQKQNEKESALHKLEERLLEKDATLDKRQSDIESEVEALKQKAAEIRGMREKVQEIKENMATKLSEITKLSEAEALERLMKQVEERNAEDIMVRVQKLEIEGEQKLLRKAQNILATSIQRLANSTASELMTSTVDIPNDDVKGKIIGKEGRNIRAFERATGVEVVIDETPGAIMLSSFDSVRRQIARVAMEELIKDGRIQPARIEEIVAKAKSQVDKIMKEKAEQAIVETGVFNLDPRLVAILGRLHFRTSYGQNVLQHSIEMTHISAMLAEELGGDVMVAKAGALLHDIGKAVDHEIQGTHVEIGRKILTKFGVNSEIVKAMQSHHEEYPYENLESVIVQTADAISGGRPGARRDSVENYLKRLKDLEEIANAQPGVEKSYAIAAGREIRVFVNPKVITDLEAMRTAQDIARKIERELKYPGEIKVMVIRENRVIEHAR